MCELHGVYCVLFQIWETGVVSPLESPRGLTDDLPSFSLSPLPYITEVTTSILCSDLLTCEDMFLCVDWRLSLDSTSAVGAIYISGDPCPYHSPQAQSPALPSS